MRARNTNMLVCVVGNFRLPVGAQPSFFVRSSKRNTTRKWRLARRNRSRCAFNDCAGLPKLRDAIVITALLALLRLVACRSLNPLVCCPAAVLLPANLYEFVAPPKSRPGAESNVVVAPEADQQQVRTLCRCCDLVCGVRSLTTKHLVNNVAQRYESVGS